MSNLDFYIYRSETDQLLSKEHLDNLLLQGLASGESIVEGTSEAIEATEEWWEAKRAALMTKIQQSK